MAKYSKSIGVVKGCLSEISRYLVCLKSIFVLILFGSIFPTPDYARAADHQQIVINQLETLEQSLTVPRIDQPPTIESLLNGYIPATFGIVEDFRQNSPGDGTPASERTAAGVAYDDENIYVAFIAHDDPALVRGRMSKRENISGDDTVIVYLDTFNSGQNAYYFTANPLGIQLDGVRTNEAGKDDRFDTVWYTDGRVTDFGYVVLFTIPFKSLRFSKDEVQQWGIALGRSINRKSETSFWPYITRRQSSFLQQLGTIKLSGVSPGRNIWVIPYGTYTNSRLLDQGGPGYDTDNDLRGGFDVKAVIANAHTLDLTYNPDFSQVETDDPQLTVNQRFEVSFPEKRPFFLDNIDSFETPLELLYTRRIIDPEFGGRLTGKVDRWNYGAFFIDDQAPGERAAAGSPLADERTINGVGRVQREFGEDSNIGILLTGRTLEEEENKVLAADTRLAITPNWVFTGQAAYSDDTSYTGDDNLESETGSAYLADLSYNDRNLSYLLSYKDISPDFEADLGFIKRTDIRRVSQYAGYFWYPENGKILSFGPSWTLTGTWDHEGEIQDKSSYLDFRMDFAGPFGFEVARFDTSETYLEEEFDYGTTDASFYYNSIKEFTFYGGGSIGTGINYNPPTGVDPFKGDVLSWYAGFEWRPVKRVSLQSDYNYYRFEAPDTVDGLEVTDQDVYTNQFIRLKLNLQFTKELSLRFIADYNFLEPNPELFNAEDFEQMEFDVLLTYLVNPFTALYVGYNTGYENFDETPAGDGLVRSGSPDYNTQQQFFMKLTYLFQF